MATSPKAIQTTNLKGSGKGRFCLYTCGKSFEFLFVCFFKKETVSF